LNMERPGEDVPAGDDEGPEAVPAEPGPPDFNPTPPEDLADQVHMEAEGELEVDPAGTIKAVGQSFHKGRVDAVAFSEFVKRTAAAIEALATDGGRLAGEVIGRLQMLTPRFASAEVTFILGPNETKRLDEDESSPSRDAAALLAELVESAPEDLLEKVADRNEDSVKAVREFLKVIREENLEIEWTAFNREPVNIDGPRAASSVAALEREGEFHTDQITVIGHLEMAHDGTNTFSMTIGPGERDPLLKGRQKVQGSFTDQVGAEVKRQGLWGSDVQALVEFQREREGSAALPKDARFTLISVAVAPEPDPPPELPPAQPPVDRRQLTMGDDENVEE